MKKVLLAIFGVAMLVACQPKSYEITGTLEGATSERVILKKIRKGQPVDIDTTEMVNGIFTFTGSVDAPELFFVSVDGKPQPAVFFASNSKIAITGDVEKLSDVEVTGSELTDILTSFNDGVPGQERSQQLQQEYQMAYMSQDKDKQKLVEEEMQSIMEDQRAYFKKFVDDNANNECGLFLAMNMAQSMDLEQLRELIAKFETNYPEHVYFQEMKDFLAPLEEYETAQAATAEGAMAPDFTLPGVDGSDVSLNSFKGKYVLVDFWASWCQPCRQENPNVVKAYEAYNAKGFEVLSVSVDRDQAAWKKAIEEDGLTWTQVIADEASGVAKVYAIQSIPSTFLLDKEGKIIAKNLRGEALEAKLAELLN
ncbi:TlpA disulfide reductase family protein [Carboxylicivirga sp. M1479]|uniref:TlpA disulfide reductase family protein n=1 Tax=Carboxylicivirga sp. M1479 TaxID=2594476 RepID=UPI00117818B6|nr:TlpA disulfide reductase family protein [Carboxylicivirga sp. M1479]TRX70502.1 AhpC/TSA family protein [Carboxylicivirga sp. M1479]